MDGNLVQTVQSMQPHDVYDIMNTKEDTLFTCFQSRKSCVEGNLSKEIEYLLVKLTQMKEFIMAWLEIGERLGHMAMEEETEL